MKSIPMKTINWYHFFLYVIPFFLTIQSSQAQDFCPWIYENNDIAEDGYEIENDMLTLLYCANSTGLIWAPEEYINVLWEYEINNGGECEDWDWTGTQFYLSIDANDPCLEGLSQVTVTFTGFVEGDTDPDV